MSNKYNSYKASGIEWLGEIPSHWEANSCRSIVQERDIRNEGALDKNYLSVMAKKGVVLYKDKGDVGNKKPEDLSKCKIVLKGDFVLNSMNYRIGSYGISSYNGICSPVYIVLYPLIDIVLPEYSFYIFEETGFQQYAQSFGNGILEHRRAINWSIFKNLKIPYPPLEEQEKIAKSLDIKTQQIDELITNKQDLISLLKEQRQSIISETVTKGLNPSVMYKDSGIEWLGEIPSHWDRAKIKNVLECPITDGPHETPEILETGIPFLSAESVKNSGLNFELKRGYVSLEDHIKFSQKTKPQYGDILMVKSGATTGNLALVTTHEEFSIWSPLALIRCDKHKLLYQFMFLYMHSVIFIGQVQNFWSYGTQQNIGMGVLGNLYTPLPPLEEQEKIVDYLDTKTTKIDTLISDIQQNITQLKEYRQSLISELVTGKRKV